MITRLTSDPGDVWWTLPPSDRDAILDWLDERANLDGHRAFAIEILSEGRFAVSVGEEDENGRFVIHDNEVVKHVREFTASSLPPGWPL